MCSRAGRQASPGLEVAAGDGLLGLVGVFLRPGGQRIAVPRGLQVEFGQAERRPFLLAASMKSSRGSETGR